MSARYSNAIYVHSLVHLSVLVVVPCSIAPAQIFIFGLSLPLGAVRREDIIAVIALL